MKHSQTERLEDAINEQILLTTFRKKKFHFQTLLLAALWCYCEDNEYKMQNLFKAQNAATWLLYQISE